MLLLLALLPAGSLTRAAAQMPSAGESTTQNPLRTDPFTSSVARERATTEVLQLSLLNAINRGLKNNLGLVISSQEGESARAARLRAFSELLPNVTTRAGITREKVNLAVFGFPLPVGTPSVVGPFDIVEARAFLTQNVLDLTRTNNVRAAAQSEQAARFSEQQARELVVLVVGNAYLLALADAARVETTEAQFRTGTAVYDRAVDLKKTGVVAGIDVLRAQVQAQSEQQRLLSAKNDYEKQKLMLARMIGLAPQQRFELMDKVPYAPAKEFEYAQALQHAFLQRPDFLAAEARVRAAEAAKRAAQSEALPTIQLNADYGAIGRTFGDAQSTYTLNAGVKFPVFQGGKVRALVEQAESTLKQRQAERDSLRSNIEFEIQSALLDIRSAAERVSVAQQSVDLANQQFTQAQDRYAAGVSGSLEVVQAQEALTQANENMISALYAHNVAKLLMARALGVAERETKRFLEGK